uniref:Interleukin-1 n=1 Tax=Pagrus major TaxID=143350 RepID=Q7ZZC7_PAGMA|nr:interleukin-1b [Pagrus major]
MQSGMTCNVGEMWGPKMPNGLDLEITHHPLTMKRVVNLIIAMERLKGNVSESPRSTEFTDENLLNMLLESAVEERIVFERTATPAQYKYKFQNLYSVMDSEQRHLVRVPNSMELHAVMLQGGTGNCQVQLNMATYLPPTPSAEAVTVTLCIKDTNLYLSCHKEGDEPTLHLEAVDDKDSLLSITPGSDMVRFLFYKHVTGLNNSTLVSVPFSSWYISTAEENNKPVEMCQETTRRHRIFKFLQPNPEVDGGEC